MEKNTKKEQGKKVIEKDLNIDQSEVKVHEEEIELLIDGADMEGSNGITTEFKV